MLCDSYTLINARGGIQRDNLRMELYVNNVADEEAWTACTRWSDFASPSAFAVFTAFQGNVSNETKKYGSKNFHMIFNL